MEIKDILYLCAIIGLVFGYYRTSKKLQNLLAELRGTYSYWVIRSSQSKNDYSKEILSDIQSKIRNYE